MVLPAAHPLSLSISGRQGGLSVKVKLEAERVLCVRNPMVSFVERKGVDKDAPLVTGLFDTRLGSNFKVCSHRVTSQVGKQAKYLLRGEPIN